VLILLGVFFVSFASAVIPDDCPATLDMVAYWRFEDDVLDSYGSHDGGVWSGDEFYGPAKVGEGASFSGVSMITASSIPPSYFTSSFTTEMWVLGSGSDSSLFKKGGYEIEWDKVSPTTAKINVTIGGVEIESDPFPSAVPHHVAVVWDSSGSLLSLYIDGIEHSNTSLSSAGTVTGDLVIGDGFTGLIDELAIYESDLTESIINAHMNLGNAGKDYCDASGAGGTSRTEAVFNIQGCSFDLPGGGTVSVSKGQCSADRNYYCSEDKEVLATLDWGLGCAMGDKDYAKDSNANFCCPSGGDEVYFCNDSRSSEDLFKCDVLTENCFDQDTKSTCNAIGCIWLEENEVGDQCVPRVDEDCGYYQDEQSCHDDNWSLGTTGIGTELCGTTMECNGMVFSVPENECSCKWYPFAPEGQKCQVKLVGVQMFYAPDGTPNRFECSNVFKLEECIDGVQKVNWTSNSTVIAGFNGASAVPFDCLEALDCVGGAKERSCGEPLIKLPGFSLFAFFASLFFVGMYYIKKLKIS